MSTAHGADQNYWVESRNGSIVSRPAPTGSDLRGVFLSNEEQRLELQRIRDELRVALEQSKAELAGDEREVAALGLKASSLNKECSRLDGDMDRLRRDMDRIDAVMEQSAKKPLDIEEMDGALEVPWQAPRLTLLIPSSFSPFVLATPISFPTHSPTSVTEFEFRVLTAARSLTERLRR